MNFEFVNDKTRERFRVIQGAEVHSLSFGGETLFYHRCGKGRDGHHFEFILDKPEDASVLIGDGDSWIFLCDFDWERLRILMELEGIKVERFYPEPDENISD